MDLFYKSLNPLNKDLANENETCVTAKLKKKVCILVWCVCGSLMFPSASLLPGVKEVKLEL